MLVTFQNILIDPANPCGIGPKAGSYSLWQLAGCIVQVFKHTGSRPVEVSTVFKDDIDKRKAEERIATNDLCPRDCQHLCG